MKAERLQQVSPIFHQVVELPPEERPAFLAAACAGDAELRQDVERLIYAHEQAGSFIESPAYERDASLLLKGDPSESPVGQLIGHYKIEASLGKGGMGEVYLARDTKLGRSVALKILPSAVAANEERMRRFILEAAKAAASLNHPNIAHIYEVGETDGTHFIAMEHVDGVTIGEKIHREKAPLGKLIKYLTQVAEGLAKAHGAGIVHRDLKPDNIMIARDDYAKILDFGLAKLIEPQRASGAEAYSSGETATNFLAQHWTPGMIMGTAGYMSPEQAQGKVRELDHRSDIFSFGCILFEAATRQRAFQGKDTLDSLHKVVHAPTPQIRDLNSSAPDELQRIVRRCLAKEPDKRYQSIKDVAIELDELRQEFNEQGGLDHSIQPESGGTESTISSPGAKAVSTQSPKAYTTQTVPSLGWLGLPHVKLLMALFVVAGIITAGYFILHSRPVVQRAPLLQQLVSTFGGSHSAASFSPDGSRIAFTSETSGVRQVWTKNLLAGEPQQITHGDDQAERPRWSPAGDEIIYTRGEKGASGIWSIPSVGGTPRKIIEGGRNPNWSRDGKQLVFERGYDVWTANRDGSDQRRIDNVPPTDFLLTDRMPAFSPDGSLIAIFQNEKGPVGDYWVVPVSGGDARRLTFDHIFGGAPTWVPDGQFVVFPSQRAGSMTLWKVAVAGGQPEAVLVSAGEDTEPEISHDGSKLIYTNTRSTHTLMLTDPTTLESRELKDSRVDMVDPSFSPDGSKIVFFGINDKGDVHIFTIGTDGKNLKQVTQGTKERNIHPHWSADGATIYFYQFHPTVSFRKVSAKGGESTELVRGWEWGTHNGARVDPEGKRIIYSKMDKGSAAATMIRDIAKGTETAFTVPIRHMRWSHDGRFIAGTAIPGSNWRLAEINVCAVDGGACRKLAKGYYPRWSHTDERVYFFPFTEFDGESLWVVSREGGNERKIMDLRPMYPISDFFDVSSQGQVVWVKYSQSKQELWLADLSNP